MRAIWIDKGNNPANEKLAANGIDANFFDPRDERVTKDYLVENCSARFRAAGIYIGAGWGELGSTPKSHAEAAFDWIVPLRKGNAFPKVQWDLEMHDPEFILAVLRLYRATFPWQDTSWTLEPGQGGLFGPEFIKEITQVLRVRVVPQLFGGAMQPFDVQYVLEDLLTRGWPATSISLCHDAARLGIGWKGFAFTQGRLP